jgi:hypothetical protein
MMMRGLFFIALMNNADGFSVPNPVLRSRQAAFFRKWMLPEGNKQDVWGSLMKSTAGQEEAYALEKARGVIFASFVAVSMLVLAPQASFAVRYVLGIFEAVRHQLSSFLFIF